MHVQRLRVSGFKSFADPVDLRIEPGLTGVVGPNGCGKSNLLEALRWVMGAASAKAMRADGMDEVIFGGSGAGSGGGSRPARNHAEVALQLDNSDRTAPAAFNDAAVIEVTRRIDRGQGSTYRVNGAEARARDVQLLFADASTGANSPSLVRQGQISELIAAKPSNRRRILEEAAGVSGLHGRRHEAELRLRAAEANLERLDDLARELESGVGRLRREARQAETYRRLGAEIRTLQAASALARFTVADRAQADAGEALTTAEARAAITAGEAARAEATALSVGEALPRLREEEMVAAAVLQRLAIERDRLERDLEALRAEVARAQGEAKRLAADAQREEAAAADAAGAREKLALELKGLEAQVAAAPTRLPQLEATLAAAERARGEADAAVERLAAGAAAAEAGRRAAAERLASAATARRAAAGRLAEAQSRCARVSTALDAARREAACAAAPADDGAAAAALAAAQAALDDARAALESAEAEHTVAREAETAARDAARRRDDALRILKVEAEGLVRAAAAPAAAFPPALDRVRPAKGYEAALAAALGDELDAALDQAAPAHWAGGEARAPEWPRGAEPLAAKLDAPPELAARLALVAVVGREDGERLRRLVPVGARLVSREGDLWRWDGFTVRAEAPRPAAVRLQQRARLADLQAQVAAAEPQARAATDAHGAVRDALAAADLRLRAARAAPPSAERALAAARGAVERLEREAEREASRRQAAAATMERLSGDLAEAQAARDRAAEEDAEAAAALAAAGSAAPAPTPADDRRLAEARHGAQAARQAEAAARSALDAERAAQKGRARRGETLAREVADWSRRLAAARARSDEIARDGERARAALARLRDAPAEADGRRARLLDEVAVAERRRADSADALAVAEATRGEAERVARAAAAAAADAREARAGAAARLDAARDRRAAAEAEVERVTGADPAALAARLATEAVAAPPDPAALQAHLETLTLQRDRLGAVNLRAEEELSEAAARLEAMRADRADLTSAMAKLRLGVDALNAEGRERVLAAFATIDRSFRDLFAALFEGGEARLELVESDDPLEAGLEIFACPPGKRLSTMSLMSGGEQALTACALIFAVFLANPAPLCVLDEVDAPLDDANVDRFCRLLDEMRRLTDTRFLAITHNPVTMSRMDRLYGVTMPERGVSQLVSVDLKRAEALVAAG